MPLYEYECDANGHRFEVIQKFSDPPVDKCPTCGSPVHKLMSSPAIQFKGTGWYVTDYARKSGDAKDGKPAKGAKEGGDSTKESKDTKETKTDTSAKTETSASTSTTSTTKD